MAYSRGTIIVEAADISLPNDDYQSDTLPPILFHCGCSIIGRAS